MACWRAWPAFVVAGVGLEADDTRLLVLEEIVAGAIERHRPDNRSKRVPDPAKRRGAQLRISVFDWRVQPVPELHQERPDHVKTREKPVNPSRWSWASVSHAAS